MHDVPAACMSHCSSRATQHERVCCVGTGCQLVEALQPAIHKAAAALSAQLALSFFMPLCLTAFANLARLRVSTHPSTHSP